MNILKKNCKILCCYWFTAQHNVSRSGITNDFMEKKNQKKIYLYKYKCLLRSRIN